MSTLPQNDNNEVNGELLPAEPDNNKVEVQFMCVLNLKLLEVSFSTGGTYYESKF